MILGIESLEIVLFYSTVQHRNHRFPDFPSRDPANQSEAITTQQPLVGPKLPNSFWKATISREARSIGIFNPG